MGYTQNEGSSKLFSSLLLGVYNKGKLQYAGKVGTGFNDKMQRQLMAQFKTLVIKSSPLVEMPDYNKPSRFRPHPPHADATWLKPKLVCEITFTEITEDGVFRHPSFKGIREDKAPADVVTEQEQPTEKVTGQPAATGKKENAVRKNASPAPAGAKKDIASKLIATPGAGT